MCNTNSSGEQIRVLHIVGAMNRGGVETWLMRVLRTIDRERFRLDFLVQTNKPADYDEEIRSLGSTIIPCPNPRNLPSFLQHFRNAVRSSGPYDVVHSHVHHFSGFLLPIAKLEGIPIRIAHSHSDRLNAESHASFLRKLYLAVAKNLIDRSATAKLACTEGAATSLFGPNWQKDARARLVHYGIPVPQPLGPVHAREQMRGDLGIPIDAYVIGHVGRFAEPKNHSFIVDVFEKTSSRDPNAVLLLVGNGYLRGQIEAKVKSIGLADRVIFAGTRADVQALLAHVIDIFFFPSLFEGVPITLLEAQIAGVHCVVSDVISHQVDVIPSLIHRLSLRAPLDEWADDILSRRGERLGAEVVARLFLASAYSMELATNELLRLYAPGEAI